MKKIFSLFISSLLFLSFSFSVFSQTHVNGYYRKDGTYVHSYTRKSSGTSSTYHSSSNSSSNKNYSTTTHPHYYSNSTYGTVQRDVNGKIKRSSSAKYEFMKMTGYPNGRPGYIVDHIIPLYKGGCDCPANMQWQTKEAAKEKDKLE